MNWNKYPFLRLVIAFSAGILLAGRFTMLHPARVFGVMMGLMLLETLLIRYLKSYRYRWVSGLLMLMLFVMAGYLRARVLEVPFCRGEEVHEVAGGEGCYVARVCELPVEKGQSVKILLELKGFRSEGRERPVSGKVMAYLEKSAAARELGYGEVLAFSVPVEEVPPPRNPEEFDYRTHLSHRGVTGRVYLKEGDWVPLGLNDGNRLLAFALRFRASLLYVLQRSGVTEDEFGVGAAILLGYDESLPAQVRQNYVAAGAMHVLCVSGMHVGVIYMLAAFVLGLIGKGRRRDTFKRILLLALVWFYALITGLSPSILRSTFMITMLVFGVLVHRKGFTLNSMAASAFVLLLVNPNNLYAIGFQLSYAAVLGIFLLQPPIYNLIYVRNKLLDKAWEITAVSLAAQVATMPFTVYYFHQCTPYFWLSNLLMTPVSFVVIMMGMLLFLVSWVPWLSVWVGKAVWWGLHGMNGLVSCVEHLPLSLIKGLYMNRLEFFLALLLLLLILLWVQLEKKRMWMEMLVVGLLFATSLAFRSERTARQQRMVVYSLRNHTAVDFIDGASHLLLCDEGLLADPVSIDYSLKGYWARCQLWMNPPCYTLSDSMMTEWVCKKQDLVSFHGALLAFWDPGKKAVPETPLRVDYLIVRGKQRPDLSPIMERYRVDTLLIDGSVPKYLAKQWVAQAEKMHTPYINIGEGAYIQDYRENTLFLSY